MHLIIIALIKIPMTQTLIEKSIDINMGHPIKISQDISFEHFVGQFQAHCPKLLCVVNGTTLCFHENIKTIPLNIRFDYKQRRGDIVEYYFRDLETNMLYCVFGRDAALLFYPNLNTVDKIFPDKPTHKRPPILQRLNIENNNSKDIVTIIDNGVVLTFPNPNYAVEILTYYPS